MSDLDDKLRDILEGWYPGTQYEEVIARLKQAFADEGFMTSQQADQQTSDILKVNRKLDGQEWYDRFVKEYSHLEGKLSGGSVMPRSNAIEAAKKASGL